MMDGRVVRSVLFVPGDRPDRIATAHSRGADAVVVDLEDAVAEAGKERARQAIPDWARTLPRAAATLVRVNAVETKHFFLDMAALAPSLHRIDGIVLPKTASADDVGVLARELDRLGPTRPVWIMPIVETADGIFNCREIAKASDRVLTLMFGAADLAAEVGARLSPDGGELAYARSHVVLAAAAARVRAPLDGPYLTLEDPGGLAVAARSARRLGFGGKGVIHPAQIEAVHAEFGASTSELDWARSVLRAYAVAEASGSGVARLADGTFVDKPMTLAAQRLLGQISLASRAR
jgi:citrate lyase subunit beta/citryl-CoA lyase